MQDSECPFASRDIRYRKVAAAAVHVEGSVKQPKEKVEGLGKESGKKVEKLEKSAKKVEGLGKNIASYADKVAQKAGEVIIMRPGMHGGYKK